MTGAARGPVRASELPAPLRGLAEQLWSAVDDDVRFLLARTRRPRLAEHVLLEQYAVVPTVRHARLVLPAGPRAAAHGAAVNYRALRPPRERAVRGALGAAARAGLVVSPTYLHVLAPAARPAAAASLPLRAIGDVLGEPGLRASIGLRSGANRKATLQLVRPDGTPAGFAKLGWHPTSDDYVRTESRALADLERTGTGRVRVPRRLAALDLAGHPVVVSAPLPASVRAIRGDRDAPTPAEVHDLAPVVRSDRVPAIGQVTAVRERLAALGGAANAALVAPQVAQATRLLDQVADQDPELRVAARWHGDLTPWNSARDGAGRLWVWDWEASEPDAPAGLDPLHWAVSRQREIAGGAGIRLADCVAAAAPALAASGVPRRTWDPLVRIYLATTLERTCSLVVADGGWGRVWIRPAELAGLVRQADRTIRSG